MCIGRSFKTCSKFGKLSDPRVNPGPRRFSQNWGCGGRVLAYMVNCSTITVLSGVASSLP